MAKVDLVTRRLGPEVMRLAQALASQQNDVTILTGKSSLNASKYEGVLTIPVHTPFDRWSALEAFRLIPRLLTNPPEVIHFIYSERDEEPGLAEIILAQFLQAFPRRAWLPLFFISPNILKKENCGLFFPNATLSPSAPACICCKHAGFCDEVIFQY